MTIGWAIVAALVANGALSADETRFVACPIYRDTDAGKKSGCWLADDPATGIRHDVSLSPTKPDWNRAVLVEGRAATKSGGGGGQLCGGVVLDPVRVSVLDELCTRFRLEAEGFTGRVFALPQRNVRPLYEPRTPLARPFVTRHFTIPFDFGSGFIVYQLGDYYLDAMIDYALDVAPARITVTGHAATVPVQISGRHLVEPAILARDRADIVVRSLVLRGVPRDTIRIVVANGDEKPGDDAAFDGLTDAAARRVDVAIDPG